MKTFTLYKRGGDGAPMSPQEPGYKEAPYYFQSFQHQLQPRRSRGRPALAQMNAEVWLQ